LPCRVAGSGPSSRCRARAALPSWWRMPCGWPACGRPASAADRAWALAGPAAMSRALRCCALRRQKRDLSPGCNPHPEPPYFRGRDLAERAGQRLLPVTVVVGRIICFCSELGVTSRIRKVALVYLRVDEINIPPCCSGPRWRLARSQTEVSYGSTCPSSGPAFAEGIRVMKVCFVAADAEPPAGHRRSSVTHETPAF
jgi:hypothetical protein